jgi:hypothetical protein
MSAKRPRSDSTPSSTSPGVFLKLARAAHEEGFLDPEILANLSPASRESLSSLSDVSHVAMCEPYGCGVFIAGRCARARGKSAPQMFQIAKWSPDPAKLSMPCAALTSGKVCAKMGAELASARTVVGLLLDVRRQSRESLGERFDRIVEERYSVHTDSGSIVQLSTEREVNFRLRAIGARWTGEHVLTPASGGFMGGGVDVSWSIVSVGERYDASVEVDGSASDVARALERISDVIRGADDDLDTGSNAFERLLSEVARDCIPTRGEERALEAVRMEVWCNGNIPTPDRSVTEAQRYRRWMIVPDGARFALVANLYRAIVLVA